MNAREQLVMEVLTLGDVVRFTKADSPTETESLRRQINDIRRRAELLPHAEEATLRKIELVVPEAVAPEMIRLRSVLLEKGFRIC